MTKERSMVADSAIVVAGVAAFLYGISTARYYGFLRAMGLDLDVLDRGVHQVIYAGFTTVLMPGVWVLGSALVALFIYSHNVIPSAQEILRRSYRCKRKFVRGRRIVRKIFGVNSEEEAIAVRRTYRLMRYVAAFFAITLALAWAEHAGSERGKKLLAVLEHDASAVPMATVFIHGREIRVAYVGCASRNCAGIDLATKTVVYFPQDGHLVHRPPERAGAE